jgi:hypothetical protein
VAGTLGVARDLSIIILPKRANSSSCTAKQSSGLSIAHLFLLFSFIASFPAAVVAIALSDDQPCLTTTQLYSSVYSGRTARRIVGDLIYRLDPCSSAAYIMVYHSVDMPQ